MPRSRKISTIITDAAIFILLEVAALVMLSHRGALQQVWISRMGHRFMAQVWGGSDNVRYYFSLKDTNRDLAEENFYLRSRLSSLMTAMDRQEAGEKTAELGEIQDFSMTPARVVKVSRNRTHNYFILDVGAEDGIRPQTGVITSHGVVGIIDAVDRHYSFGLSLLNSDISVSARIGRDGASGRLSWDGRSRDGAVLGDIPLQYKFNRGDTVWTSGHSSVFPPGIPLGTITGSRIVGGAVNEIEVRLLQDFSSLRFVTVTESNGLEEMAFLEGVEREEGAR